jgi:hypothetical protein
MRTSDASSLSGFAVPVLMWPLSAKRGRERQIKTSWMKVGRSVGFRAGTRAIIVPAEARAAACSSSLIPSFTSSRLIIAMPFNRAGSVRQSPDGRPAGVPGVGEPVVVRAKDGGHQQRVRDLEVKEALRGIEDFAGHPIERHVLEVCCSGSHPPQ